MIETYQIKQLEALGHKVEVWFLGSLFGVANIDINVAPEATQYLTIIQNLKHLKTKIGELEDEPILFSQLGLMYYYPILFKVVKSRKDIVWVGRLTNKVSLVTGTQQNILASIFGTVLFFKLYKPFSNLFMYAIQKIIRKYGKATKLKAYEPDYLMVSNRKLIPHNFPKEKVILTHADDYNIHLINKKVQVDSALEDAIVFLDQMIFYHPDFKDVKEEHENIESYYKSLNTFLNNISEKYNKTVVIAGHPESEKYPNYAQRFPGKQFVIGKSVALVRSSYLVVTHYSAAVNFATIYNKPVLLIESVLFARRERIIDAIKLVSSMLDAPIIKMESFDVTYLNLNTAPNYNEYREKYIKPSGTPDELSHPYVVKHILSKNESRAL
ncbi:hypothetical protein [Pontibacter akesuensis]|nr:hypothetical protein [Pontibacter akesuensis]